MTDMQAPAAPPSTPPGWYSDPWNVTSLRWWDGTTWTGHVAGAMPPAPIPSQPNGHPGTFPVWLIAVSPFWAGSLSLFTSSGAGHLVVVLPFMLVFNLLIFGLAYVDSRRVIARGYRAPSFVWGLLPPVYLVLRLRSVGRKSLGPLIVYGILLVVMASFFIAFALAVPR